MLTYNNRLSSELSRLIYEHIDNLKEDLSLGLLESHDHYRHITGQILGLRISKSLIDEAFALVEGRERN